MKSFDDDKRELEGVASTPTPDRVNDVINPFGLTFQKEAPLLLNHKSDLPVGSVTFGTPTAQGLPFKAKIAKVTTPGVLKDRTDEAWDSVKTGLIKGVSIGFISRESKELPNGGTFFNRAEVHELSLTAIPCNPEAVITAFKSAQTTNRKDHTISAQNFLAAQIRKAAAMTEHDVLLAATTKAAVPAATSGNTGALYYPDQLPGVTPLKAQITSSIIEMLRALGAPSLPPNTRILTQAENLTATEIPEGGGIAAFAPQEQVTLSGTRKFGGIVVLTDELLRLNELGVLAWVEAVLTNAANNATDDAVIAALTSAAGAPQTSVDAAFDAFEADLRTACWIGNPTTLGKLRSAQERDVSPRGGTYYGLPALPALLAPAGTLFLVDAARTAVYDGPLVVDRAEHASIRVDSAPDTSSTALTHLFQESKTALRVVKYADLHAMSAPVLLTVA